MSGRRISRLARMGATVVLAATAVVVRAPGASTAAAQAVDASGEFTPVTPARILDTRTGEGRAGSAGPLGPGASSTIPVAGRGGVPATGVSAVVLNVTAVGPTGNGFLTVWPSGQPQPYVSNVNFVPGQTVPNMVTVAVGDSGAVDVFNAAGATHVLFDVVGFYSTADGPAGLRYFTQYFPMRAFDTRNGAGGVAAQPLGPGGSLEFQFGGSGDVPTGARAVVMNVTVTAPTGWGYLSVFPADVARPEVSSLNFVPGQTVANLVTVPLSANGRVRFHNAVGSTHVIADVFGYYAEGGASATFGRFVPMPPYRASDTRIPPAQPVYGGGYIYSVPLGGAGAIPAEAASAVATNVTVTAPSVDGYLTAFPNLFCEVPGVSNLNYRWNQTVPNMVIVTMAPFTMCDTGNRESMLYAIPHGRADVIVDVFGYFTR
jgi:hypothetical protein